jgi:hypothetical protein
VPLPPCVPGVVEIVVGLIHPCRFKKSTTKTSPLFRVSVDQDTV